MDNLYIIQIEKVVVTNDDLRRGELFDYSSYRVWIFKIKQVKAETPCHDRQDRMYGKMYGNILLGTVARLPLDT